MAIDDAARNKANKVLSKISSHNQDTYYSAIPLDRIYDAVEDVGYHIPEEEKTCILCGHEGKTSWPLYILLLDTLQIQGDPLTCKCFLCILMIGLNVPYPGNFVDGIDLYLITHLY